MSAGDTALGVKQAGLLDRNATSAAGKANCTDQQKGDIISYGAYYRGCSGRKLLLHGNQHAHRNMPQ